MAAEPVSFSKPEQRDRGTFFSFCKGIEAALKAPTAVNQQKFQFSLKDGSPYIRVKGLGAYAKVDLGIVACHFEAASGKKVLH